MTDKKPVIILGGGGHAIMLYEILLQYDLKITAICSPIRPKDKLLSKLDWISKDQDILDMSANDVVLVNALGSISSTEARHILYEQFKHKNFDFIPLIHKTATISGLNTTFQSGLQCLPNATINANCRIGENVLINTRSVIEHGCKIGDHSHIAPGAIICGDCEIGHDVHIGAGAVINQGLQIGNGSVIASGAVVIKNIEPHNLVAGVPAKVKHALK